MKRTIIFPFCVMALLLVLVGCESSQDSENDAAQNTASVTGQRVVTKRLCSIAPIGNMNALLQDLESEELDDLEGDVETETPEAPLLPEEEVRAKQSGVLSSLTQSDDLRDDAHETALREVIDLRKSRLTPEERRELEKRRAVQTAEVSTSISMAGATDESVAKDDDYLSEFLDESFDPTQYLSPDANSEETPSAADGAKLETPVGVNEPKSSATPVEEELEEIDLTTPTQIPFAEDEEENFELEPASTEEGGDAEDLRARLRMDIESEKDKKEIGYDELESEYLRQAEEFCRFFATTPASVVKELEAANFQNYTMWTALMPEGRPYAVRTMEYVGQNFESDYLMLIRSPNFRKWNEEQAKYLQMNVSIWTEMTPIWTQTSGTATKTLP
ncbi:MAG: hypothetical protein Q4D38_03915 [Planctomycetia bacterium]|nr:hypothetical protein [Planctomycetia bacterium]